MKKNRKGFTLIELVVVTVIIGIMASMAIPLFLKTVESSKASDAVAIGHMLGNSYRMYLVDHPGASLSGQITNACNTGGCDASNPCQLVRCNYVAKQNWDGSAYNYFVGGDFASSVSRKTGASPGTSNTPYSGWGYTFSLAEGRCATVPSSGSSAPPSCPNF